MIQLSVARFVALILLAIVASYVTAGLVFYERGFAEGQVYSVRVAGTLITSCNDFGGRMAAYDDYTAIGCTIERTLFEE